MVKIEVLIKEGKVSRIRELEIQRYVSFFENSYRDNLKHCEAVAGRFPRWSIISGYYAMHDITKLLLAKKFRLKIDMKVHSTTIKVLKEVIKNKVLVNLMEKGYSEFVYLANDLAGAKRERIKSQYYTGTEFMREEYEKRSREFIGTVVKPYLEKIEALVGDMK